MSKKFKVIFDKKYIKELKYIHPTYHQAIADACHSLSKNPRPNGFKKIKGSEDLYRIRVGPYRIIYTIQDQMLIVLVLEIGDRKDIYNNY